MVFPFLSMVYAHTHPSPLQTEHLRLGRGGRGIIVDPLFSCVRLRAVPVAAYMLAEVVVFETAEVIVVNEALPAPCEGAGFRLPVLCHQWCEL